MERPQVPLDIVVLSDLADDGSAERPPRKRWFPSVDRNNLDDLLREVAPSFSPAASASPATAEDTIPSPPDPPAPGGVIRSFRDFRPERLVEMIPEARELQRLRSLLDEVAQGRSRPESVHGALASIKEPAGMVEAIRRALDGAPSSGVPPAGPPPPGGAAAATPSATRPPSGGSLFDLVDVPGSREALAGTGPRPSGDALRSTEDVRRRLDGLIEGLLGLGRSPDAPSPAAIRPLLGAIDLAIADILRAALMDSRFRAFESAWLSLRFLVRRLDFRGGVHLHVYAAPRTEILDALRGTVFPFLDDLRAEGRLACVLMDYSFGDTEKDLADLMEISEVAAEARTPIVTAVDPSILGLRSFGQIHTLPDVSEIFETADRRSWGTLRGKEESRWLFLCMNRFLLRPPYGRDGERVRDFDFEEFPDGTGVAEAAALSLWGRPVWPVGALVADSFARTGWGVEITGPGNAGSIGDLPVRPIELRTGEIVQSPLEVLPSESRVLELSRAGIIALAASRNTDQAFITSAPSFFRPIRSQDKNAYMAEARRATLPYQLFLAQILSWTESIWGHLNPHSSAEDVADTLARGLQFLVLGPAGPIAKVSGEAIGAELGTSRVSLVVEPLGEPLRGLPPIALELPLPRG